MISSVGERRVLRGICGSPGIAVGPVMIFDRRSVPIPRRNIAVDEIESEIERLTLALAESRREIELAREAIDPSAGAEHRLVLEAYLLMHRDELLVNASISNVNDALTAEWALRRAADDLTRRLASAREPYLSERARDVEHVATDVLRALTGRSSSIPPMREQSVLVASDLSPAETAQLKRDQVLALVTDLGTATSHTAILARALGIPAVVGVNDITRCVSPGDVIVVDALRGEVVLEPEDGELHRAEERARRYRHFTGRLRDREGAPGRTRDGVAVELLANIELEVEVDEASRERAEGIGLYRTEFLYLDGPPPTEEAQVALYARVGLAMAPRLVTLRTFDLGADKLPVHGVPRSPNPALGLRGLRLALARPELLVTQLRAMMRAAVEAPLRAMFPMVCTVDDLRSARKLAARAKSELEAEGVPHRPIALGSMIEVPSAVAMVDVLARESDFFSIGTNDLVQYALAVDRSNARVAQLVRPVEPAVLRMLDQVARASREHEVPVCICGDLAAHAFAIPILMGLGFRSLSMPPSEIPLARELLDRIELVECNDLARDALQCATGDDIEKLVMERFGSALGELWEEQGFDVA